MSKWSRLKAAILAAGLLAALNWGGCLNPMNLLSEQAGKKIIQLVTIDNLFD